ncbi:MAG: hypothetical protein AAGA46_00030 [Cyanobacteria bacterium P01_F01_bin.13]
MTTNSSLLDQLSVFDAPIIVDSAPILIRPSPEPVAPPQELPFSSGDLVVPKAREGYPVPLFPNQVCEVVKLGESLG